MSEHEKSALPANFWSADTKLQPSLQFLAEGGGTAIKKTQDKPFCDLVFYGGSPIKTDSLTHNIYLELADEWIGRLTAIIASK